MAKRKKRKASAPNLPDEVLERARKQLDGTLDEGEASDEGEPEAAAPVAEAEAAAAPQAEPEKAKAAPVVQSTRTTTASSSRRSERRRATTGGTSRSATAGTTVAQRSKRGELDGEQIAHLLANPTKIVSEEELHEEYGYVLRDLRNMGILAATLFVVLVMLAQFI